MRKRPQELNEAAWCPRGELFSEMSALSLVLSGGGARAAYQVGALQALAPYLRESSPRSAESTISTIVGSSIGAVNGLILGAGLRHGLDTAISGLVAIWERRTFRNSFSGSPSRAFFRALQVASMQLRAPGPNSNSRAVFDPTPLGLELDAQIRDWGGLLPENRASSLKSVAVMTTIEGAKRKPLLFLSSVARIPEENLRGASFEVAYTPNLDARHGLASAALPSIMPPVELDTENGRVKLVDGGIAQNHPVDPAVRLGADSVILIDVSGRDWWHDRYGKPHDERPSWEIPAGELTFCLRPSELLVCRCLKPLGPILKEAVGRSSVKFIRAVGPVWPLYTLLRGKLGEEVAYEVASYIALDPDYLGAIMAQGLTETAMLLKEREALLCLQKK
jgi:predicted acylesterase/phospholipase RssA